MNWYLYFSFVGASLLILATPGPSLAYAFAIGSRASRREILLNVLGMGLGGLTITLALTLGVAQLLETAPTAFGALQITGCVYLIWLGFKAFVEAKSEASSVQAVKPTARAELSVLQGFLVETANPKAILFYSALVPQFADRSLGHVETQLLVLGGTFVAFQVLWDASFMLGVRRFRTSVSAWSSPAARRLGNRLAGTTFMSLGLALLFYERPST